MCSNRLSDSGQSVDYILSVGNVNVDLTDAE